MNCKHVALMTGTRAEFGLLRPVIERLITEENLKFSLLVTGAHLSEEHGNTVSEIREENLPITAEFNILTHGHGENSLCETVADAILQFSAWFCENKPDVFVVLGDRYEAFAATQAAAMQGVPIAHISGGDVTLGAADEYYRHCITKMAKLHFASCADSAKRLLRLGEQPTSVHNVGGLGDENLRKIKKLSLSELSESVNFDLTKPFALVTFHPETAGAHSPESQMNELLSAMGEFTKSHGMHWLITKANADAGGEKINAMVDDFAEKNKSTVLAVKSLGLLRYLSAMQEAAFVAGNSSSGVVETPTFGVPTLNIGDRQKGRIICDNVLCTTADKNEILNAFNTLCTEEFKQNARATKSPYNGGNTAEKIVEILKTALNENELQKPKVFYDGV